MSKAEKCIHLILGRLTDKHLVTAAVLAEIVEKLSIGESVSEVVRGLEDTGVSPNLVREIEFLLRGEGASCAAD